MTTFRKTASASLSALVLGATLVVSAAPAEAGWHHRHHRYYGAPIAAGVVGALALGAIAASGPVYASDCRWSRRSFVDGYGDVYVRRVRVCG